VGSAVGALLGVLALASLALLGAGAAQSTPGAPCAPAAARPAVVPAPTDPPVPPLADFYLTPYPSPVIPSGNPLPTAAGPSRVEVRGEPYHYTYTVNGAPAVLRGMGYNVAYRFWGWDCEARARRYDRDFAAIRGAGFNTLIGWDEGEFDDLTLAKAQEHGLGVVFPYDFPRDGDWDDPAYRLIHTERVEALVRRYAGHPALRMWGLGNEVILGIGDPASPRARAFGQFYAALAERVHQLDPTHPIIYRDGEDQYYGPIRDALRARDLEQPWMIYGMTAFTFRLQAILDDWPTADFRVPLVVSEFGLVDYPLPLRAEGLARMWDIVRQHDDYVLGGAVYAWTTEGIETTDIQFGLVDGQAQPIDGSLAALSRRLAAAGGR
jgi:beta-galactosidase/beta-glucuronidase